MQPESMEVQACESLNNSLLEVKWDVWSTYWRQTCHCSSVFEDGIPLPPRFGPLAAE